METSEDEDKALQSLLDAFPTVPLDLIASAYVDAHSDQQLAAEIIALSLNDSNSGLSSHSTGNALPRFSVGTKPILSSTHASSFRQLPGSRRPPTLEEYFPSSLEKSAWEKPLSQLVRKDSPSQDELVSISSSSISTIEFPLLGEKSGNGQPAAPLLRSSGFHNRIRGKESAAFGLASSARAMNRRGKSMKASTGTNSKQNSKDAKQQADKAQETSLWPTDAEVSLISMLGDGVDFDIEALRDVLGFFKGDVQKSFMILQQMYSSSPSNVKVHEKVQAHAKVSSMAKCFEDVPGASSNVEGDNVSDMNKVDDCSTSYLQADQACCTLEEAILKQENSSMKWVVECLCKKYPYADTSTVLEVLRETNFDLTDADKMMQESSLHNGSPGCYERKECGGVARDVLKSLFSKPQEVTNVSDGDQKKKERQRTKNGTDIPEVPRWRAVTSTELDMVGDEEEKGQEGNMMQVNEGSTRLKKLALHSEGEKESYGDWNDYERHQTSAKQHWVTMQSYSTAATAAYASSDFQKSELLTQKANTYKQLSLEAKQRANACLTAIHYRQSESNFTLDLREQHILEALQLLRFHLKMFSSIPSCHKFSVIVGCPENPKSGHKKIREEVLGYLEKKGYTWVETSPYNLQIQLKDGSYPSHSEEQAQNNYEIGAAA